VAVETRQLPQLNLPASRLGFGGAPIGLEGYLGQEAGTNETVGPLIEAALANGVTYFDTAPGYGDGRSESLLGHALKSHRDRVLIASKCLLEEAVDAKRLDAALTASLDRLQTDRIDVYQLHGLSWADDDVDTILSQAVPNLEKQKQRGRIGAIGITSERANGATEALVASGAFDALQVCYNFCYQGACDYQRDPAGVIPLAKQQGMIVGTMRTSSSGLLPSFMHELGPELDPGKVVEASIRFVLSTPEVDVALVGMRTPQEVQANAELAAEGAMRFDLPKLHNRYPGATP